MIDDTCERHPSASAPPMHEQCHPSTIFTKYLIHKLCFFDYVEIEDKHEEDVDLGLLLWHNILHLYRDVQPRTIYSISVGKFQALNLLNCDKVGIIFSVLEQLDSTILYSYLNHLSKNQWIVLIHSTAGVAITWSLLLSSIKFEIKRAHTIELQSPIDRNKCIVHNFIEYSPLFNTTVSGFY